MSEQVMNTQKQNAEPVDARKTEVNKVSLIFSKMGIYAVLIMLVIVGMTVSKGQFFAASNIQSILEAVSLVGMVAAGALYVTYSGNMCDMSIPMTMAMGGMITVQSINFGFPVALLLGIASGALIGLVNGLMIGRLRANAIIWTWGFNLLLSGIVRVVWGGKQLYADKVAASTDFAQNSANTYYAIARTYISSYFSLMAVIMIAMFVVSWFIHSRTKFGQKLKLIGSNYEVAKFSGIDCGKMITITYVICGICASIGGIFFAALRKTASYENGTGYDFTSLTAVLLGGILLTGGKGTAIGAFGGVIAYGVLNNILSWVGLGTYEKYLVQGLVFLFIVWLNTYTNRKLGKA